MSKPFIEPVSNKDTYVAIKLHPTHFVGMSPNSILEGLDGMIEGPAKKARLAFAKAHANEMWQTDTMHGPYLKIEGQAMKTYLICFIDDASRIIPHGEFYLADSTTNLIDCFQSAVFKRGVPKSIYADNGSNYSSKEFSLINSRLGILLIHTPVRDGAAKGKIERFFRTVRDQFLIQDLSQITTTIDVRYNRLDPTADPIVYSAGESAHP